MKEHRMPDPLRRTACAMLVACCALLLSGCTGSRVARPAPVEDRVVGMARPAAPPAAAVPPAVVTPVRPPGATAAPAADAPGSYVVKPGDTLIRIGLETGQNWRDIARWNNIENPNVIEVGQVLRVVTPVVVAEGTVVAQPVSTPSAVATPVPPATSASAARPAAAPVLAASTPPVVGEEEIAWIWPSSGPVLGGFDEAKNKGVDIGGKAGDPVLAVADGRVVYAGAGLRGYGNLIILKHNNLFLTAYAHNQALLVKEDQSVRKGQRIAEMGSSDSDRVKLHFEIRRQGKPVDPVKYLPPR
jgi:lipoprotein NlpD